MITEDIIDILEYDVHIREVLSSEDKNFLVQKLIDLFAKYIPLKSQTRATENGAWFESEYDEGFNACVKQINEKIS